MAQEAILEVSLKDYKKQIDDLRGSLLNLESTSKEYQDTAEQIRAMQDKLNEVMGVGKREVDAVDGSYNQLSQTLSNLKKEWKTLEIGSERWQQLGQEIDGINEKLKEADASVGVFGRNVGNYQQSFEGAIKSILPDLGMISPELGKMGGMIGRLIPVIKSVNATATAGLKGIKAAIASTGIGALVIAIGLLSQAVVKNWDKIKDWVLGLKEARKAHEDFKNSIEGTRTAHERYIKLLEGQGATAFEIYAKNIKFAQDAERAAMMQYAKDVDDFGKKSKEAKESLEIWQKAQSALTTTILDSRDGIELLLSGIDRANKEAGMSQLDRDIAASNQKIQDAITLVETYGAAWHLTADEIAEYKERLEAAMKQEETRIRRAAGKSAAERERDEVKKLLEEVEESSKTELQKLDEKYQKQKRLLEKHHKDTTALTAKYAKERKAIEDEAEEKRLQALKDAVEKELKTANGAVLRQKLENEYNLSKITEGTEEWFNASVRGTTELMEKQREYIATLEAVKEPTEEQTNELIKAKTELNEMNNELREQLKLRQKMQKESELNKRIGQAKNAATSANMNTNTSGLWNSTNFDEGYQARIEAAQVYYDAVKQMQYESDQERIAAELEAQQQLLDIQREYNEAKIGNYMELASSMGQIFGSLGDLYAQDIANQVKNNKMGQKEAERQYKKVQALKVSEAIIQTIQGALATFMGYQSLGQPWGAVAGAVAAAAVTAAGMAQVAQIKAQNPYSSTDAGASMASYTASVPVLQDYNPQAFTNLTGAQDTQALANALADNPVRAYVVESEVTAKQEARRQRDLDTTF